MRRIFIITISIFFAFSSFSAFSFEFDKKFEGVKREIVKDDIGKALKVLGKINISNDKDKEQSQLLFGDIYLHINKPNQAIEFYQKSLFTSNNDIENLILYIPNLLILKQKHNKVTDNKIILPLNGKESTFEDKLYLGFNKDYSKFIK